MCKESQAIALLKDHPDWTVTKIAETIGVSRTTPYSWEDFKKAKEAMEQGRCDIPRGSKDKDGNMEAWDD